MALSRKDLLTLAKTVARADSSSKVAYSFGEDKFSYNDLNETLRSELREIAGTYQLYRENRNTVFSLIENTIDDILPQKVLDQYGQFAEIKQMAQGDRAIFTQRITVASKRRAKQFVTKVGLAGIYEVFKLDGQNYEVPTSAFGGAAQIGFEEFLDGRVDFADVLDIVMEGLDEAIYLEIERALKGAVAGIQPANKHTDTTFNEAAMDRLIQVADTYGKSTIYCTYEFAGTMIPSTGWVSDEMRNQKWQNGYLGSYKGHNVIVLRQSFEDETNEMKVIDPSYAWIIPTGTEKPVKIVFEGVSQVREYENRDWSRELQTYKKVGVGALIRNNICVYCNTSLTRKTLNSNNSNSNP